MQHICHEYITSSRSVICASALSFVGHYDSLRTFSWFRMNHIATFHLPIA